MTYGEKRILKQNSINFKKEIDQITDGIEKALPPKMSRVEAVEYYGEKLRKAFLKSEQDKQKKEKSKLKVISLS